jgi:hypothetical protein
MNVIVETNFIIELALEQAEEERISLAIPAFAQACKGNSEDSAL